MTYVNLKKLRSDLQLTQRQIAKDLVVSQSTISFLENGIQKVAPFLVYRLQKVYNIERIDDYLYEKPPRR